MEVMNIGNTKKEDLTYYHVNSEEVSSLQHHSYHMYTYGTQFLIWQILYSVGLFTVYLPTGKDIS
jgi:hypothetical protein